MHAKYLLLVFILLGVGFILACSHDGSMDSDGGQTTQDDTANQDDSQDDQANSYPVQINFSLPAVSSKAAKATSDPAPNEYIYIDLEADNPRLSHAEIPSDGQCTVGAHLSSTYLIGLTHNPTLADSRVSSYEERAISDSISMLGNIKVVSNDLDSLPLSETTQNNVDLGEVTQNSNGESFNSDVSADVVAEQTGRDTDFLLSYGSYDKTLKKLLNPDINANGTYDTDENINWELYSEYLFSYQEGDFDVETGDVSTAYQDFFNPSRFLIYFRGSEGFGTLPTDLSKVSLVFPEDLEVRNENNEIINEINPRLIQPDGEVYQFNLTNISHPEPFFGGDYKILISEDTYYFDNIEFINPADNYKGFLFPIFDWEDNGEYFTRLKYRWNVATGEGFRDASQEEIEAIVDYAHFEFTSGFPEDIFPLEIGKVYGEIGVLDENIRVEDFNGPGMQVHYSSGNNCQFWYNFQG